TPGARGGWPAWTQKTTRPIWTARGYERFRGLGVWVLFRRVDTSLLSSLCAAVHHPVHPHASHQSSEPTVDLLCESTISRGRHLLELDYLPGLQRTTLSAPHAATAFANAGVVCGLAGLYHPGHQSGDVGNSVAIPRRQGL
ncbi:MAG: hypothetical protein M1823_007388, partial [Watsoniomyces obsoletus]